MSSTAGTLRNWLELVRFSHTIFALPFAAIAYVLAFDGATPSLRIALLCLVAMVCARTAAMAYNRLVDRDIDAENPRTRNRHLPAGLVTRAEVLGLVVLSCAAFVATTWFINRLAFVLAVPVLIVLLGYSHMKRFFAGSHFVLGIALGLAPLGVWVAVHEAIDSTYWRPAILGLAVMAWVAGFDLIYSCQDVEFDRGRGLHSIPARIGIAASLRLARVLHVVMLLLLVGLGGLASLGTAYYIGIALTALLLIHEHRLVHADDLSKVDVAFFTVNGVISFLLLAATILDAWLR